MFKCFMKEMLTRFAFIPYFSCCLSIYSFVQGDDNTSELPALTVMGQETANQRPVTTYENPISNLDFDPRVDMQSRNMAEAQGDLSIRGGTFENTGIQVGSSTLLDPQTGHYSTEIPIAPEMLGEPKVLTGADNALRGFNSSVGTVKYTWREITKGGSLTIGGGDHDLNFQRIHNAITGAYGDSKDLTWGAEIESSRSESDGTIPFGDHSFKRTSGRIQILGPDSQTDIFAGYQDKYFGWPGMYTANINNLETEDLKTRLFFVNHSHFYGEDSFIELSAYHRRNTDHFELGNYIADHITEVSTIGFSGRHPINNQFHINHSFQFTADDMVQTSAIWNGASIGGLDQGPFTERNYYKISIVPEYEFFFDNDEILSYKFGASWADTNRDDSSISPVFEVSWNHVTAGQLQEKAWISYSESTQVLGYGAIGGSQSGRFASDPTLGVSSSRNLESGFTFDRGAWKFSGVVFHRWDDNLVDWTFELNSSSSRSANHVDIDTFGIELIASREWDKIETIISYSFLKKREEYGDPSIYGSFYALNYPEHRATLGVIWEPIDYIEIRLDNEWRDQRENVLREGPDNSIYSHLAASYYPSKIQDLEIFMAYDKPWDEDFQDVPGTPGRGDQFSFGFTYSW